MFMKKVAVLFIFAMLPCLPITSYAQKTSHKKEQPSAPVTEQIFQLVNKHRQKAGLKPLQQNDILAKVAEGHSRNMASGSVPFSHDGFEERVAKIGKQIKNTTNSAENVAYSSGDAASVVEMWLKSKGHRKNIEGNYTISGIGTAKAADGTMYYTQIFIKSK